MKPETLKLEFIDENENFTTIRIDNSTDFKDFIIETKMGDEDGEKVKKTFIQINTQDGVLDINGQKFEGLSLEFLARFLKQI